MQIRNIERVISEIKQSCDGAILCNEDLFFNAGEDIVVLVRNEMPESPAEYTADFFEIIYAAAGNCRIRLDYEELIIEDGNICILAPGNKRQIEISSEDAAAYSFLVRYSTFEKTFFSVLSDKDVIAGFFRRAFRDSSDGAYIIFRTEPDAQIKVFTGNIIQEYQQDDDYKNRMMINLMQGFLIILLRHHNQKVVVPAVRRIGREDELFAILNYVHDTCAIITADSLSAHFGFSTRHLARLIRQGTGMSPGELIRTAKLQRAVQLLETTDLPVDEIAHQAGYAEHSGFHRAFKKYYGIAPAMYRSKK